MRTRVKICGITSLNDAKQVSDAGADAIGLVFYERSPRNISISDAAEISRSIPPFVNRVALFKDATDALVSSVIQDVGIDLLQFHGNETPEFCRQFERPYIKAVGLKGVADMMATIAQAEADYDDAKGMLLDGHAPGEDGGSGESLDWSAMSRGEKPVILAGGLKPENVRQAIELVQPYAVDVSSGVETAPGIKGAQKVKDFIEQVRS